MAANLGNATTLVVVIYYFFGGFMKGIINLCVVSLVKEKFGDEALKKVLKEAGLPENFEVIELEDYPDEVSVKFINAAAKVLNLKPEDIMIAFGDYWINDFAPKKYRIIYKKYNNAKDFLKGMSDTHMWVMSSIEGAKPPKFEFEEPNTNVLIMHYFSNRKLEKILEGLILGVIKYFNVKAEVKRIESSKNNAQCAFEIKFF